MWLAHAHSSVIISNHSLEREYTMAGVTQGWAREAKEERWESLRSQHIYKGSVIKVGQ